MLRCELFRGQKWLHLAALSCMWLSPALSARPSGNATENSHRRGTEWRGAWCRQRRRTGSMGSALDSWGACQDSASIMAPASSDVYQMDDESHSRRACLGSVSAADPARGRRLGAVAKQPAALPTSARLAGPPSCCSPRLCMSPLTCHAGRGSAHRPPRCCRMALQKQQQLLGSSQAPSRAMSGHSGAMGGFRLPKAGEPRLSSEPKPVTCGRVSWPC